MILFHKVQNLQITYKRRGPAPCERAPGKAVLKGYIVTVKLGGRK